MIAVSVADAEDAVEITISDTGEGIAPLSISPASLGTSGVPPLCTPEVLGMYNGAAAQASAWLVVAQNLVEAQGGRIWAKSPPGEDATFRFTPMRVLLST